MTDHHHDWLTEQPAAVTLLAAYAERESLLPRRTSRAETAVAVATGPVSEADPSSDAEPAANEAENADAWIPRLRVIEGVDSALLSPLHGGLIARGLLKCELFGRQHGMRYRLTPDGRRAVDTAASLQTPALSTSVNDAQVAA